MRRVGTILTLAALLMVGAVPMTGALANDDHETLAQISRQLVRGQVLRANFHQEKIMRALKRPLTSDGQLIFVEGEGVLWQVKSPYAVRVLIKSDEFVEWQEGGTPQRQAMGANPLFDALSGVFLAAFGGDFGALSEHFDVKSAIIDGGWQLDLAPREAPLATIFSAIQISGASFVEKVRIAEAKGDETRIQFSGFTTESSALEPTEKAYFDY